LVDLLAADFAFFLELLEALQLVFAAICSAADAILSVPICQAERNVRLLCKRRQHGDPSGGV